MVFLQQYQYRFAGVIPTNVNGQWAMVNGQWSMVNEQWSISDAAIN